MYRLYAHTCACIRIIYTYTYLLKNHISLYRIIDIVILISIYDLSKLKNENIDVCVCIQYLVNV